MNMNLKNAADALNNFIKPIKNLIANTNDRLTELSTKVDELENKQLGSINSELILEIELTEETMVVENILTKSQIQKINECCEISLCFNLKQPKADLDGTTTYGSIINCGFYRNTGLDEFYSMNIISNTTAAVPVASIGYSKYSDVLSTVFHSPENEDLCVIITNIAMHNVAVKSTIYSISNIVLLEGYDIFKLETNTPMGIGSTLKIYVK